MLRSKVPDAVLPQWRKNDGASSPRQTGEQITSQENTAAGKTKEEAAGSRPQPDAEEPYLMRGAVALEGGNRKARLARGANGLGEDIHELLL